MPADWIGFIDRVSSKLDDQSIEGAFDPPADPPNPPKNIDDFATFLAKEYTNAIVGKAQSPFGNTHVKGQEQILISAFTEAFKMLEKERSPSFEEKLQDPKYKDLRQEPGAQNLSEQDEKFNLEFLAWTQKNPTLAPNFTYSLFFPQFPQFPATEDEALTEVARNIISRFDGTSDYLQWIYTLRLQQDELAPLANRVYDKILELTQGLGGKEIKIGDEIQALSFFRLLPSGFEDFSQRSTTGELVRGKVVQILQPRLVLGKQITFYRVSVQTPKGPLIRTVDGNTIQKKLNVQDFKNVRAIFPSRKILQEVNGSNPQKIPKYLTRRFVTRFTYDPASDRNLFSRILLSAEASGTITDQNGTRKVRLTESELNAEVRRVALDQNVLYSSAIQKFLNGNVGNINSQLVTTLNPDYLRSKEGQTRASQIRSFLDGVLREKITRYNSEETAYANIKRAYTDFLTKQNSQTPETVNEEDPYEVMANGVIRYWQSCLQKPLSTTPPVPPCAILPPGNGTYIGISYGSVKTLADNLRRAFNDGKSVKSGKAGDVIAKSLANTFQKHLLELKFVYNGGIPTPGGPAPMVGFVPSVF